MAETNPYRIEEEKWTPNSVYEILPPNTVSWTNYQYSEGSDNVDSDKAHSSLLSGVVDFFGKLLGGVGKILGGAIESGVGILGGIVQGVTGLIGGIASAIGSIFGGGNNTAIEPPEPIFNPIKTNLEGAIQPHLDDIEEAKGKIEAAQQEQESIKKDIVAQGKDLSTALSKADKGIADAKAAQEGVANAVSQLTTVESALKNDIAASSLKAENALSEISKTNEALQANAAATADLVAGLQTDFSAEFEEISLRMGAIVETQGGLAEGLGKAATQADYNKLNEVLWGRQVDINQDQQELNKRRREWEEGAALALENLSEGAAAQTRWNAGAETAIDALARIMGLNIGARNLLKKSMLNKSSPDYLIASLEFGDNPPLEGEEVTLSLKGALGEGSLYFSVYNSSGNGAARVGALDLKPESRGEDGVYRSTGAWKEAGSNSRINIYAYPSDAKAESTVEWVKLERGNKSTDWSPAPEDVPTQAQVDEIQNNAISRLETVTGTTVNTVDALKAAVESIEQIVSLDNSYKAQQELINEQLSERQDILEEIQALQNQMISRSIVYDGKNDTYDDYLSVNGQYVVARGTWVGAMVITTERRSSSSDPWRTNFTQYKVPHLGSRTIRYYSGLSSNMDSARIDYWVYAGKSTKYAIEGAASYISGSSFTEGTWGLIKSFTMPENVGGSILNWESKLLNADRSVTYQVRLLVDGVQKKSYKTSGKGPMFPWESGVDYVKCIWDLDIPSGATVRIEGAASGSKANSTRAQTSYNRGTLTYVQLPEES